jgi:hypothetical protein
MKYFNNKTIQKIIQKAIPKGQVWLMLSRLQPSINITKPPRCNSIHERLSNNTKSVVKATPMA